MSAHDQIRAMLDQLMGTSRNGMMNYAFKFINEVQLMECKFNGTFHLIFAGEEEKITVTFDDPRVCKPFLLGCCQYSILEATVSNILWFTTSRF